VAIEAGLAEFGNLESIISLLKQVGEGTVLGRFSEWCGNYRLVLGIRRIPAVLGQAMPDMIHAA